MLYRLLVVVDKKDLYLFLSIILLVISIFSFNIFDYKYCNAAEMYKEKTEDVSGILLTTVSKEMTFSKSFIKDIMK